MTSSFKLPVVCFAALLAGCAANPVNRYDVSAGTTRDAVVARMGQPQRIVPLPNGERFQYSLQPAGYYAWMVDLDSSGRVVQANQVLTAASFGRIEPGKWTRDDVEREFGRPAWIDAVGSWKGPIMTYRWKDIQNSNMFYYVYLDERNMVQRAHPAMEFFNGPNERN